MKRCILLIVLIFNNGVFAAEKQSRIEGLIAKYKNFEKQSRIEEVTAAYKNFKKAEERMLNQRGNQEAIEYAELSEKLIILMEMANPLYQDDFPQNLLPRVIRELIRKHGYSIHEAEEIVIKEKPEAKEILERIANSLYEEKRELAKIRIYQRQR